MIWFSRLRRRADDDRGAALLELLTILPFLALLVVGIVEFGLTYRDNLTVTNAARSGVRVGSNAGSERRADYEIIRAVQSALQDIPTSAIERVVVYDANIGGSLLEDPPSICKTTVANGVNAVGAHCNVYHGSDFQTVGFPAPGDFGAPTDTACAGGDRDIIWCPTDRIDDQSIGVDALGVWISIEHDMTTGLLPWDSLTISENAIMNIEPNLNP